jgi:hypothetical protein
VVALSGLELAPGEGRRGDHLRLLHAAWGPGAISRAELDWWLEENPEGFLSRVALRDGEVVGAVAHGLVRVVAGGRERLGQVCVHAVTDGRARRRGVFSALERALEQEGAERGSALALVFPNAGSRPVFLGPLGWSRIDRRRLWARPLPGLRRGARGRVEAAAGVRALERFGPEQDAVYAAAAPLLGNHVVRDSRFLNWRYPASPRSYAAFASPRGFAVVGRARRRGLRLGLVMELVAPREEAPALLRRCAAAAGGAHALLALPSPCLPRSLLARHGFLPAPARLDLLGKGLAEPLDARGEAWTIWLGDTDFF